MALLFLGACGEPYRKPDATAQYYTVRPGDTVYSIAWRHGLDYRELARWNRLPSDYSIYPGQRLTLRPAGSRAAPPPRSTATTTPSSGKLPTPAGADNVENWLWPTEGVTSAVSHAATGSQGLTIAGREGQVVRAAASGRVVYLGSGLRGFGQLVIIKHTNVFLSAYGHNRALSVHEGEEVTAGQAIAEMGLGPNRKPMLYFEIRYNGKPVDPRLYLPAK
ncbi:MAG TPA: peptidoglycan DD-metalloendopeptidase family protein [Steroidobacteraceae bacterium]|nr:peptidoglycan DD-metalloendopeptidase family protein [Steroidobacteraceae bacterium]